MATDVSCTGLSLFFSEVVAPSPCFVLPSYSLIHCEMLGLFHMSKARAATLVLCDIYLIGRYDIKRCKVFFTKVFK